MTFRVGQKCICVNAKGRWGLSDPLKVGLICTIRAMHIDRHGDLILRFHEIERSSFAKEAWGDPRLGYLASRFRPLTDTKHEVSFTEGAPKDSEKWDNRKKQKERV